jgi:hypothetical protein
MKVRGHYVTAFFSVLIVTCLISLTAKAQLIDDFSVNDLANYTTTIVLAQNADGPMNFAINGGALQVSRTFTSGNNPQQDLFLRGDFSLGVGQTLQVDITSLATTNSPVTDFGIAIAGLANPTPAIYTGANVDVRSNMVSVEVKPGSSEIGANFFDGRTQTFSGHNTTASEGNTFTSLTGLWISEPSAQTFSVGYIVAGTNFLYKTFAMNNGSPGDTSIGAAVGFFADIRPSAGTTLTSPALLDNLQIVPEPSTFALMGAGLGFGALLLRRKRNRA